MTRVLLGLTAVSGLVDAVSFLALGHVFTANMTGNILLLAFALTGVKGLSISRSLAALACFLAGVLIGGRLANTMSSGSHHRFTSLNFAIESALLFSAAICAIGFANGVIDSETAVFKVIVFSGLAMGIRSATVRKIGIPDLNTIVLTLTITGLVADSSLGGGNNAGWARRTGALVSMFVGAALGAWLIHYSIALTLATAAAGSGICAAVAYHARN